MTSAAAFDRFMSAEETALIEKVRLMKAKPAVIVRCGKGHTMASVHLISLLSPLTLQPGLNDVGLGKWALWLRSGQVHHRAAAIQGWPRPTPSAKRWAIPEAVRVFDPAELGGQLPEPFWWLFCSCADAGDLSASVLARELLAWRVLEKQRATRTIFRAGIIPAR